MGFGISGIAKSFTKKALIRYLDPTFAESTGYTLDRLDSEIAAKQGESITGFIQGAVAGSLLGLVGVIQSITPDVRKSETHKFRSTVTEVPLEDGSIAAQHIIQHPIEMTLQFEETNAGKMFSNLANAGLSMLGANVKSTFDQLYEIWEKKLPVQIVTEQKIYNNMVVQNMPIMQNQPYKEALKIMVDFKQLTVVTLSALQAKSTDAGINKSAAKKLDGGHQITQKVTDYARSLI